MIAVRECVFSRISVIATESIETLAEAGWRARQRAHEARVHAWTDPHQARAASLEAP